MIAAFALVWAGAAFASPEKITFGSTTCAPHWVVRNPGVQRYRVVNNSHRKATVYLFRSASGAIAGTIKGLRAGHSRVLKAKLTAGVFYSWGCDLHGYPEHISDSVRTPRTKQYGGSGQTVVPVVPAEMIGPLTSYRAYVKGLEPKLVAQVAALSSAIASGDLATAESAWLAAHLTWLKLGQDDNAYGAFGELGRKIDGTAAGYPNGTANPKFTGFHRIELDLWTGDNLTTAASAAARLQGLVAKLQSENLKTLMPGSKTGITNFTLRVHEVLEDAVRDSLSADDDYGSNTDVASITADVDATRELLTLLAPVIQPRAPRLVAIVRTELKNILSAADASKSGGDWVGIAQLPVGRRQQLDATVDAAVETLSRVPDLLQLGKT